MTKKLKPIQIKEALKILPDWEFEDDGFVKTFEFEDFDQAWEFMSKVAAAAKEADHHPEWTNVYSNVLVRLSTHDVEGVTKLDIALAKSIESIFQAMPALDSDD